MSRFLDESGVAYFWEKIKKRINTHLLDTDNPHGVTAEQIGAAMSAHGHARSEIIGLIDALAVRPVNEGISTSGTGTAYTATVDSIIALITGVNFVMIPHTDNTSTTPTLNVNGLGAKTIRRRISDSTTTTTPLSAGQLAANKPVRVTYDGTYWITEFTKPNVTDLYGTLTSEQLINARPRSVAVTLTASGWDSTAKTQTVAVSGVSAIESAQLIHPTPTIASQAAYIEAGVLCTGQAANSLTFTATTVPTANLVVYVVMQEVTSG